MYLWKVFTNLNHFLLRLLLQEDGYQYGRCQNSHQTRARDNARVCFGAAARTVVGHVVPARGYFEYGAWFWVAVVVVVD